MLAAREVARALERAGFMLVRQTGSHAIYRLLPPGEGQTFLNIGGIYEQAPCATSFRESGLTRDEFIRLL